jgi:hypothetical protein
MRVGERRDNIYPLFHVCPFESLPGEGTAEEVIAAGLLDAQMGVDGRVPHHSGQVFVFPVQDVKMGFQVPELLHETAIDDIDLIAMLAESCRA